MKYSHLVIVPCHSIWKGGSSIGDDANEWHLQNFQIEGMDHLCFKDHLVKAVDTLRSDDNAILVISGGQTKIEAGEVSEADSYYKLLSAMQENLTVSLSIQLKSRVFVETFARDSLENVIFLLCKFYEVCGKYPNHITVSGFEFKKRRFLHLHLERALRFDLANVSYLGNLPRPSLKGIARAKYYEELRDSELKFGEQLFKRDLYGSGLVLKKKRDSRNPFNRTHPYASTNPDLIMLFKTLENEDGSTSSEFNFPWNSS